MTKPYSTAGDNNGLCERCNRPETEHESQTTMPILLGGGMGWGTFWCCPKCVLELKARKAATGKDAGEP